MATLRKNEPGSPWTSGVPKASDEVAPDAGGALAASARKDMGDCLDRESGLYHNAHFKASLKMELARLDRCERPLALILIDIGSKLNPAQWTELGQAVRFSLRAIDQAARLGERHVAALLPEADSASARRFVMELSSFLEKSPRLGALRPGFSLALAKPWEGVRADDLLSRARRVGPIDLKDLDSAPGFSPAPVSATAIAADEKNLLFDGFKRL